jgi:hypothetical protein
LATQKSCRLEASSVPDGQEIGVDQQIGRQSWLFACEMPKATPEVHVPFSVSPQHQIQKHLGVDGLGVEGGRPWAQVSRQASGRELTAEQDPFRPWVGPGVECAHVSPEASQQQAWSKRARVRFDPPVEQAFAVDEATSAADFREVAEARQFRHDPADRAVRHAGGGGYLPERAIHELGSRQHGEEDLKAGRLKGPASIRRRVLNNGALTLDEDQKRRLIQERVARSVDELDALVPQGVGEGWRHVVRDEEWTPGVRPKLVDDHPERCRAQTSFDLGIVAEAAAANLEAEPRVCAVAEVPCVPPQDPEPQAERLHGLDRVGQEASLGLEFLRPVHLT